jgi:enterochelin esterase-like enzyme
MQFLSKINEKIFGTAAKTKQISVKHINVPSKYLSRGVTVDVFLPPQYFSEKKKFFPTVFFNDGQDMPRLDMVNTLNRLFTEGGIAPFITVAIHCNDNRINEYGTAQQADYKNRGNKAAAYAHFIVQELVPSIRAAFRCSNDADKNVFAGFSLGGLSALDIAWGHPSVFGKVGVFSGSLWWRSKAWTPEDPDGGRIMHTVIHNSVHNAGMKFWFQCGTKDEQADRNNNGVIDAIDDTLDLINELVQLGYRPHEDVKYVEVEGGEHNPTTWGQVMPDFLKWAFAA